MQVLVNSDHHITGDETLTKRVEHLVNTRLGRFADRITRVEVHLNDVNGQKPGDRDKRAVMEARLAGLRPIAASDQAGTLMEAMEGAAEKLTRGIERALGRLDHSAGRAPPEQDIATVEELQQLDEDDEAQR